MRPPALLLAAAALVCASPVWSQHLDLERLTPGCGGSAGDFRVARQVEDLRRPAIQWRGAENESCLVSGTRWSDGVVSARVAPRGEAAGFALRYLDADRYLGVYVDLRAGLAAAKEWEGEKARLLASVAFDPPRHVKAPRVTAAAAGDRVAVFVEGRRILEAEGATPRAGAVALLAAPLSEAEVDEAASIALASPDAPFLDPIVWPPAAVGGQVDVTPGCLHVGRSGGEGDCRWILLDEEALPGITMISPGRILWSPQKAGEFLFRLAIRIGEQREQTLQTVPVTVKGTSWPRGVADGARPRVVPGRSFRDGGRPPAGERAVPAGGKRLRRDVPAEGPRHADPLGNLPGPAGGALRLRAGCGSRRGSRRARAPRD